MQAFGPKSLGEVQNLIQTLNAATISLQSPVLILPALPVGQSFNLQVNVHYWYFDQNYPNDPGYHHLLSRQVSVMPPCSLMGLAAEWRTGDGSLDYMNAFSYAAQYGHLIDDLDPGKYTSIRVGFPLASRPECSDAQGWSPEINWSVIDESQTGLNPGVVQALIDLLMSNSPHSPYIILPRGPLRPGAQYTIQAQLTLTHQTLAAQEMSIERLILVREPNCDPFTSTALPQYSIEWDPLQDNFVDSIYDSVQQYKRFVVTKPSSYDTGDECECVQFSLAYAWNFHADAPQLQASMIAKFSAANHHSNTVRVELAHTPSQAQSPGEAEAEFHTHTSTTNFKHHRTKPEDPTRSAK